MSDDMQADEKGSTRVIWQLPTELVEELRRRAEAEDRKVGVVAKRLLEKALGGKRPA